MLRSDRTLAPEAALQALKAWGFQTTPESVRVENAAGLLAAYARMEAVRPKLGYDIEVSNAKGAILLRVAVKGTTPKAPTFRLTKDELACSAREPLWKLLVVTDAMGPAAEPSRIFLYRRPILDEWCERGDVGLSEIIAHVLIHEIGHHLGLDDDQIHHIEDEAD